MPDKPTRPRRVVHFQSIKKALYALADDGTMWLMYDMDENGNWLWEKLPDLPTD